LFIALSLLVSSPARASTASAAVPATSPAQGWILVDADTGAVIDAGNEHEPLPPASVIKLLTALLAVTNLKPTAKVPVSARAAAMPAMRIGMLAGETWPRDAVLRSLLMVSANDAAVALAERVGGSLAGFSTAMTVAAADLGLADKPVLRDPAGLDDSSSFRGGNLISARDLAIVARAALTNPTLRMITATHEYHFVGPDGRAHRLLNHNKALRNYPGSIGLKTGYTQRAGHTYVGAATRDKRTMLVVLLNTDNTYVEAATLLDRGFAIPVAAEKAMPRLPNRALAARPPVGKGAATPTKVKAVPISNRRANGLSSGTLALVAVPLAAVGGLRLSARRRRIRRRREIRAVAKSR
jgi:D-alanyl-D-alanine carboxypeptidase